MRTSPRALKLISSFENTLLISRCCCYFLVPSLPPQNVQSYNTSSTSVNVTWQEVPTGFVHGILRGYRIFYSRTKDNGVDVRQAIMPANKRFVHLEGLDKFTNYTIQVAAFTRIGYGTKSRKIIVSTDEDGMKRQFTLILLMFVVL